MISLVTMEEFECNYTNLNESKFHFLISGHKFGTVCAKVGLCKIWEERNIKLLNFNNNQVSPVLLVENLLL